jgi:hypothetical protein
VTARAEQFSAYRCRSKERMSGSGQRVHDRKVKDGKRSSSGTQPPWEWAPDSELTSVSAGSAP